MNCLKLLLAATLALTAPARADEPALIPAPKELTPEPGVFTLRPETRILAASDSRATAKLLAERLRMGTGFHFAVKSPGASTNGAILLTTDASDATLGPEGYELTMTPESVVIRAQFQAGLFYGAQTFLELLPPAIFAAKPVAGTDWEAPCVEIKDQPRFQWRGLMLDVSRHFFTKEEVERILDVMALHKLNTLHWHLVDDQGWRIQIKRYPLLTKVGAWRKGINFHLDPKASTAYGRDGRYGGYYTQKDIREIVRYAAARHITIVPEIEMPGHSSAALASYPQFSCFGGPYSTDMPKGSPAGVYCAGNDATFDFLENILTEVFALFPGPYVHVGGDEVPFGNWRDCPKCQARMKTEGLTTGRQLESYFIQRIEKFVNAHGKTLVGWSEIREGGLARNADVMDWIGGAVEAASASHDVIMTPESDCYLDHYQSRDHSTEPRAIGGFLPLHQIYEFDPIPKKLAPEFQAHILGAQGNLWTEYIPNIRHAEYMIFPREIALAEVTWSPKEARDWPDFLRRLQTDDARLDNMGVNYRRHPEQIGKPPPAQPPH